MTNFEIFIWGNPSGFRMLAPKLPASLLSIPERNSLNPDVFDSFKSGEFYSFAYAKDSYVVSCHFFAKDKSNILRDGRTVISVAVRRGYVFGDMSLMLDKLREGYNELLARIGNVNSLDDEVSLQIERWTRDFEQYCKQDSDQLCINQVGTVKQRSIVSFQSDADRNALLNYPMRPEYIGSYLVFIAPQQDIENFRGTLQMLQFVPLTVSPVYSPKYHVYFPAWKGRNLIATVDSVKESINFTCEKKYYKTIQLDGSIQDHMVDWKVGRTDDKTGYIIGLDFEPEEVRHPVKVKSIDSGTNIQHLIWLQFNKGYFDTIRNELVLKGEEIAEQLKPVSNLETKQIENVQISNDGTIDILVREYSFHNCSTLKTYLKQRYQIETELKITSRKEGGKCIKSKKDENAILFLGQAKDYELTIPETDRFEELSIPLDTEPQTIMLKEKAGLTLTVHYSKDLETWLLAKRGRCISYSLLYEDPSEKSGELRISPDNVLKLPASRNRRIKFWANGFKPYFYEPATKSGEEEFTLHLSPTIGTIIRKILIKLIVPFIIFLFGTAFGWLIVCPLSNHPNWVISGESSDSTMIDSLKIENDSLNRSNLDLSGTINKLKIDTAELNSRLEKIQQLTEQPKTSHQSIVTSNSLAQFNKKLDGIEYTDSDYKDGVAKAQHEGMYNSLKDYFEARRKALAFCTDLDSRKSTDYLKKFLKYNSKYLSKSQVDALNKLCNNELYPTCEDKVETIEEMLKKVDINE